MYSNFYRALKKTVVDCEFSDDWYERSAKNADPLLISLITDNLLMVKDPFLECGYSYPFSYTTGIDPNVPIIKFDRNDIVSINSIVGTIVADKPLYLAKISTKPGIPSETRKCIIEECIKINDLHCTFVYNGKEVHVIGSFIPYTETEMYTNVLCISDAFRKYVLPPTNSNTEIPFLICIRIFAYINNMSEYGNGFNDHMEYKPLLDACVNYCKNFAKSRFGYKDRMNNIIENFNSIESIQATFDKLHEVGIETILDNSILDLLENDPYYSDLFITKNKTTTAEV